MKVSSRTILSIATATALTASAATSHAQMLTDLGTTDVRGQTINLNASGAFAAYTGALGANYGVAFTDSTNKAAFSNLTAGNGGKGVGQDSQILTSASNTNGSFTSSPNFSYIQGTQTLTSTLFAANQTFNIYVSQYQAASTFTFTLTSSLSATPTTLTVSGLTFFTSDNNHFYGEESVRVQGAVGDTLTISQTRTNNGGDNVGINAVTANAVVPEPGAWAILLGVLGSVAGVRRFRRPSAI